MKKDVPWVHREQGHGREPGALHQRKMGGPGVGGAGRTGALGWGGWEGWEDGGPWGEAGPMGVQSPGCGLVGPT